MSGERLDNLADLVGEIEWRLTGGSGRRLSGGSSGAIPDAASFVLVLFDGLGVAQLQHRRAGVFRDTRVATLASPFPSTTSVALASLVTGYEPSEHGLTAYLMYRPEVGRVVNTLKWVDLSGAPIDIDYSSVLEGPNMWERLRRSEIEPITVQPGAFAGSPLSQVLYRGARFEPAYTYDELIDATVAIASEPGRFVLTYVPPVDVAGHMHGLESEEFDEAMGIAAMVWEQLLARLSDDISVVGTADHGLVEYSEEDKVIVRDPRFDALRFGGDARGVHVWGDPDLIADFAAVAGGEVVEPASLYDGVAHPSLGDALVLAPRGKVILPPGFDKRLRCYHGGLDPAEVEIPLLVG